MRAHQTVVHLGCGAGFYLIPAAKLVGKDGKVVGVDIRPDMLAEVMSRAAREGVAEIVHVVRANLETPQGSALNNASADWVLIANILHLANPEKILLEAKRLVKPSGMIVVVEWDTIATLLGPPSGKRVAKKDVVDLVEKTGLDLRGEFRPSPYHYGLLLALPQ